MKKYVFIAAAVICCATLISWGVVGHKAVAKIAQNHLTPKTKEAIKSLIGHQSLDDISTWADEIRNDPQYKYTGEYHYADVESGLDFVQFANAVKTMPQSNAYKMILRCELDLENPDKPRSAKVNALKFLVHIIGDVHQPMHVSHAADKGGNNISVSLNGYSGNLHGLWDSGIIENEGLSFEKMAIVYDTATPEQIQKWQNDSPMIWLWESYQVSEILYKEAAENSNFENDYYETHLPVLRSRIEKGGIRLAGVLNKIFDK